jgi:serine/threonine protein kinase
VSLAFSARSAAFVGGYRAIARMWRGELCDVYDAWSEEREVRCAVKILRPDRRAYAPDRRRVVNEGELLLSLTHPHIVRAYEVRKDPVPFIVLEATTGSTLAGLIERGPLSVRDLARVATQMSSALGYLHRRGYVNLDVRPSNVAFDGGLARVLDLSAVRHPRAGETDESTDSFGLGCLLYQAATCRDPFGEGAKSAHLAPSLKRNGRLLPATASVVMRCLSAAPADRPSIAEVARTFAPLA